MRKNYLGNTSLTSGVVLAECAWILQDNTKAKSLFTFVLIVLYARSSNDQTLRTVETSKLEAWVLIFKIENINNKMQFYMSFSV